jgi:two-component system CheB/CheR fusion protein
MSEKKSGKKQASAAGKAVDRPAYYVGIGASAGGLEAIEAFFRAMPADSGCAFIVVQHLSPDYKSLMVELLSKKTDMAVHRAENNMPVRANHIYLIPPKTEMTIFHGNLALREQPGGQTINLPIDIFLRSLAEDQAQRAIAVILSGAGSDGTRGVRAIKELNGMVMVQDEGSAKFDGMPRAAASTGLADFILAPGAMPEQLLAYVKLPADAPRRRQHEILANQDAMTQIFAELRDKTRVDFTFYKPSTIVRRIERRMAVCQSNAIEDYLRYIHEYPGEIMTLYRELLIGVTSFFRDPEAMQALRDVYLPPLLKKRQNAEIRFWAAGCSTGEEAYTLAILAREAMEAIGVSRDIKIFATDLDRDALLVAGAGLYPESIAADLSPRLLGKYFYRKGDNYQIARHVREMVVFAQHNLVKDPPFTAIDLVSCRNLLIYLQPVLQNKALRMFNFSLNAEGLLFLGSSETVGDMLDYFTPLHQKFKIYQSRGKSNRGGMQLAPPAERRRELMRGARDMAGPREREAGRDEHRMINRFLDLLAQEYVPLAVIVNEQLEIVYTLGNTEGYFKVPAGRAVYDISRMALRDLAIPLTTGIQKVLRSGESLTYTNLMLRFSEEMRNVRMRIMALPGRRDQEPLVAVFLETVSQKPVEPEASGEETYDVSEDAQQRIKDLEMELQFSRENLQATIEELETSNEELQAANEELLASNEELQSTNEELQSTNEELYTVNAEYQNKINELTELNNDVDNLLTGSRIGKLLLDENLEIRKFSPEISTIYLVMDSDVGRPITHMAHRMVEFDPVAAIREVQRTNEALERDVHTDDGRWYLLRILPYHIGPGAFSGVVMTFVDITQIRRTEQHLIDSRRLSDDIIRFMPAGMFLYRFTEKEELVLERGNPEAERLTGIDSRRWAGKSFDEVWPSAREQGLTEAFVRVMRTGESLSFEDCRYDDERVSGAFRIQAFRLPEQRLAVSFEDITERVRMRQSLEAGEEKYRRMFHLLADAERVATIGSWTWDVATDTTTWSEEMFRIFQRDPAQGAPSYEMHPEIYSAADMARLDPLVKRALAEGEPYELELDAMRPDGSIRHCVARGRAEMTDGGVVRRLYGSMQDITDRVCIERELVRARDRLDFLLRTARLAWSEWDVSSDTMRFSQSGCETLGIVCEQGPLPRGRWLERVHPDDRTALAAAMDRCVEERGDGFTAGYRLANPDGGNVSVEECAEAIARADDGGVLRVRSLLRLVSGTSRRRQTSESLT